MGKVSGGLPGLVARACSYYCLRLSGQSHRTPQEMHC